MISSKSDYSDAVPVHGLSFDAFGKEHKILSRGIT
jgi:hypothetical protein